MGGGAGIKNKSKEELKGTTLNSSELGLKKYLDPNRVSIFQVKRCTQK